MLLHWKVLLTVINCLVIALAKGDLELEPEKLDETLVKQQDGIVNYRLPNDTHPETYDISLLTRVDLGNFEFNGIVRIDIRVDRPTNEIVLHARQLTILRISLAKFSGSVLVNVRILPFAYNAETEFLKITSDGGTLAVGDRLILEISYSGMLRTDVSGFYRSSYINTDGVQTWLATSFLFATDARHAFPCYDEPAFKAKFKIQITHGKRYNAISNMPENSRVDVSDDTATTSFAESPPMSTYLVAFTVSDLQHSSNKDIPNAFPHRVFARPADIGSTQLALQNGEKLLHALENYVGIKYSLPKMDQIAVPDFRLGGMENWGLVGYESSRLLYNPRIHSDHRKFRIISLISHEFSHMFFGDVCTPKWWTHAWLNEGFATLFEYIGTDLIYPDWHVFDDFVVTKLHQALKVDSLVSTRPMTHYTDRPAQIVQLFDTIIYEKAGSVLRMFLHAISEPTFKKSITSYLMQNSFKNVDDKDLFAALDKSIKEDSTMDQKLNIAAIFSSWSNQKGYPLVYVRRDYEKKTVTITQQRYISPAFDGNDATYWWIPFNYVTALKPHFKITSPFGWLPPNSEPTILDEKLSSNEWILFNKQQTGYYRVLYDDNNYRLITSQLNNAANFTNIHVINRAQLLDDTFQFFTENLIKENVFFDLLSYLRRETEFAPWKTASGIIDELNRLLPATNQYKKFRSYVRALTEKQYKKITIEDYENETIFKKSARNFIVNLACEFGVPECLTATHDKIKAVLRDNQVLPPNAKSHIYSNGLRSASDKEISLLWDLFGKTQDSDDRLTIAQSFGSVGKQEIREQFLQKSIDEKSHINKDERMAIFKSIANSGEKALSTVIQFVKNNHTQIGQRLDNVRTILNHLSTRVVTDTNSKEFEELLQTLRTAQVITEFDLDTNNRLVNKNTQWLKIHQKPIENWLQNTKIGSSASFIVSSTILIFSTILYSIFI